MSYIHTIAGSASAYSSASAVEEHLGRSLKRAGAFYSATVVRQLPPAALMQAKQDDHGVLSSVALIEQAQGLVVVAPVVKSGCSGVLKAYLDLLPCELFAGKAVLPVVVGAPGCRLVLEYGLRPILSALGGR
jgi:FMN reductase